ncbi:MAG TPA: methanogen output domain 1-containing protein [Nitrososphaeraceae archaeon]|nr:methanogen output domain 1-containing protein [Nitrososphaeraceae archaeon]
MAPIQEEIGTVGETKERILELLLGGSKSTGEVAESLRIQKSAARVHLETLQSVRAVRSKFKIEKMGRPKKVYELTEKGREFFPRKYDLFLNLVLEKVAGKKGEAEAREIIESIAEDIASGIRAKIDKNNHHPHDLEQSLKIINDATNQMGFASSLEREEKDSSFYIQSKNCILHKVASNNQDMICHGLHDKIISKSLEGNSDVRIELKECMALGNEYCRHIIRSGMQK